MDVSLELSSVCNQRCVYCYHADQNTLPFTRGFMDFKTAQLIIVDASLIGVPAIKFNYRGESTLNPNFGKIARFAKDHASKKALFERIVNSNFKFQPDNSEIFEGLACMTKVKVSFDSFRKEIFEKQRAGGTLENAINNVSKFYHFYKNDKTELVIQTVRTKLNADEDLEHEIKKRWPGATASIRDMVTGRINAENTEALENKKRDFNNRQSCVQAHARLIFNHEGKAQMCCPDISSSLRIGDIHKSSIRQIFNSPSALETRKMLLNKTAFALEPCKSCPSFESYKGFKPNWNS